MSSRRSLWPTVRHQELERLLDQFRNLQISGKDSLLFQLTSPHNAHHNCSDLPEVSGLNLSPSLDSDLDPFAIGYSDWPSTPLRSFSSELGYTQPPVSLGTTATETTTDSSDQENLGNGPNLSDFIP